LNDLDRKIAELKGWVEFTQAATGLRYWGIHQPAPYGGVEVKATFEDAAWSTSDSKALELVDEEMAGGAHISIVGDPHTGEWEVEIGTLRHTGTGATRPEAICRAYIAAREWMEKQGKG
jgi:hypothetical protein